MNCAENAAYDVFFAFLSHGDKGTIQCFDANLSVDFIENTIGGLNLIIEKPKVILMQCCRGDKVDGVPMEMDGDPVHAQCSSSARSGKAVMLNLPKNTNILTIYPSNENYMSSGTTKGERGW